MIDVQLKPRIRIIEAGKRLFFEHGFKAVSTDALANEASVSKATLYKYFPSMKAVLKAVVEAEVAIFEAGIVVEVTTQKEFQAALIDYGFNLLTFLNKQETIKFAQLMFEEARTHPTLAKIFYTAGYTQTINCLGCILNKGLNQGFILSHLTADELAEQLLGMWEGFRFIRAQLGLTDKPFLNPRVWAKRCVQTLIGRNTV